MSHTKNADDAAESLSDIHSAADAMKLAKAEFEKAEAYYEDIRKHVTKRVKALRKTSVGEVIDGTMRVVRHHPGASLTVAALVGLLIGRMFRR